MEVGSRIKVVIDTPAYNDMGIDEQINGATGRIKGKNDFVFPYLVELDDTNLNQLIIDSPRQFAAYELIEL